MKNSEKIYNLKKSMKYKNELINQLIKNKKKLFDQFIISFPSLRIFNGMRRE